MLCRMRFSCFRLFAEEEELSVSSSIEMTYSCLGCFTLRCSNESLHHRGHKSIIISCSVIQVFSMLIGLRYVRRLPLQFKDERLLTMCSLSFFELVSHHEVLLLTLVMMRSCAHLTCCNWPLIHLVCKRQPLNGT